MYYRNGFIERQEKDDKYDETTNTPISIDYFETKRGGAENMICLQNVHFNRKRITK